MVPGVSMVAVIKSGGNDFHGRYGYAVQRPKIGSLKLQASNLDDQLRRAGITEPPELIKNWDTNVSFGGPIKRDRLWFFNNLRSYGTYQDVPGVYANANARA